MANSKSIAAGGNAESDAMSMPSNTVDAELVVKADNDGTPASGDELTVRLLGTTGDTDADPDSTDEYTSSGHANPVAILDTNVEDPAISNPIPVPPSLKGYKVRGENGSGGRAITASAQLRVTKDDGTTSIQQVTWT
jgi:hypothetical protein